MLLPAAALPTATFFFRRNRLRHLIVLASFILLLVTVVAWLFTARTPIIMTWSPSAGETYPPWDEGDYYYVVSQRNLGIGKGGIAIAQTHVVEHWGGIMICDCDAIFEYAMQLERPEQYRLQKSEAEVVFHRRAADMVNAFNAGTAPARWWEGLGVWHQAEGYNNVYPDNTCGGVRLPLWLIAVFTLIAPLLSIAKKLVREVRRLRGLCIVCRYDLRASTGRCPECGTAIMHR